MNTWIVMAMLSGGAVGGGEQPAAQASGEDGDTVLVTGVYLREYGRADLMACGLGISYPVANADRLAGMETTETLTRPLEVRGRMVSAPWPVGRALQVESVQDATAAADDCLRKVAMPER